MNARAGSQHTGVLTAVQVFRGQPIFGREPTLAAITKAQASNWSRDNRVISCITVLFAIPIGGPMCQRREKGVDVMLAIYFVRAAIEAHADTLIIASRDTDLLPAVEMAVDFGKVQVETVRGKTAAVFD